MRKKISVIGKGVKFAPGLARVADVGEEVRGADVVVLAEEADLAEIARRAPASTVVVTGGGLEERCQQVYEGTLFPRGRILGVADPKHLDPVVESIVLETGDAHEVIAMRDGAFGPHSARLSRGGVRAFV
jgi:predicted amidohydrolase